MVSNIHGARACASLPVDNVDVIASVATKIASIGLRLIAMSSGPLVREDQDDFGLRFVPSNPCQTTPLLFFRAESQSKLGFDAGFSSLARGVSMVTMETSCKRVTTSVHLSAGKQTIAEPLETSRALLEVSHGITSQTCEPSSAGG